MIIEKLEVLAVLTPQSIETGKFNGKPIQIKGMDTLNQLVSRLVGNNTTFVTGKGFKVLGKTSQWTLTFYDLEYRRIFNCYENKLQAA